MPAAWIRILAVAALSIAALAGLVIYEGVARDTGTELVMPMQPVDPQALLSGHYVVITLSDPLPSGAACPPGAQTGVLPSFDPSMRRDRWVALTPGAGHARVAGVADTQAAASRYAPLTAHGDAYCVPNAPPDATGYVATALGVDRFYLSQAEAERIAAGMSPSSEHPVPTSAIVSIGRDGRARMKGLVVGAQRIAPGWY
jgi:hypothetical protein